MYSSIINTYEDRKKKLSSVLSNRRDLKAESQHQIYGAINEIELFVKTLREYQKHYENGIRNENRNNQENPEVLSSLPSPNEKYIEAPRSTLFSKLFRR